MKFALIEIFLVFIRSIKQSVPPASQILITFVRENLIVHWSALIEIISFKVSKELQIVLLAMGHSKKFYCDLRVKYFLSIYICYCAFHSCIYV